MSLIVLGGVSAYQRSIPMLETLPEVLSFRNPVLQALISETS